ncbi:DUF2283 domain-containing protein [Patescibacteria group bacterium]|nr:DUF2283 domain-containing protein [Patescibacteria group bacterium]MBU4481743.1 DUF2283 domain-containing protein [Patescibacteria group bacterium]
MKENNIKISYDKESEVFSVEMKKAKSIDSDILGNVVIDYDKKGKVVRVNFYNFDFSAFKENLEVIKNFARKFRAPLLVR